MSKLDRVKNCCPKFAAHGEIENKCDLTLRAICHVRISYQEISIAELRWPEKNILAIARERLGPRHAHFNAKTAILTIDISERGSCGQTRHFNSSATLKVHSF